MWNLTCNSTLEDLRLSPGSEENLMGSLNFHSLARIIAAACTLIAVVLSLFLIWMHALHYTRPKEQRQIIRILFMIPVYSIASLLQIQWYWHAIYFQVISDCYEAFAIASFFSLLTHYVAPDLHSQKNFFRAMKPMVPWVLPISWFRKCCGGERGLWRTPKSGLTWFNIIWIGVYQYCFIRVAMTITGVVTQYFDRYCESSNLPVFAHIWVSVINASAVTIAMYCLIQFYIQLRGGIGEHRPFLKVLAIKLVIFLSFWQTWAISIGTSTLKIVHPNRKLAYPDLKVGVPALLLCIEMAIFSVLHIFAFPYAPYRSDRPGTFYPLPDPTKSTSPPIENPNEPPSGGPLGLRAIWDAMNVWDFVKAFGRGIRWLFCGVKRRKEDSSYLNRTNTMDMDSLPLDKHGPSSYDAMRRPGNTALPHDDSLYQGVHRTEESAGLITHAQDLGSNAQASARRNEWRDAQPSFQQQPQQYPQQYPQHASSSRSYPLENPYDPDHTHSDYPPYPAR